MEGRLEQADAGRVEAGGPGPGAGVSGAQAHRRLRYPADGRRGFPLPAFLLAVLALVVSAALYAKLPKAFVPEEDMGVMYVDCKLAEGSSKLFPSSVTPTSSCPKITLL